jgi:hypothetical protein
MAVLQVAGLPEKALAAAAEFHLEILPKLSEMLSLTTSPEGAGLLVVIFPSADHSHRAWRLAAVQALAREFAPVRVNALASDREPAIAAALAYLETAEGVTGQLLELDDTGAGEVLSSPL